MRSTNCPSRNRGHLILGTPASRHEILTRIATTMATVLAIFLVAGAAQAGPLRAGAAKINITHPEHPAKPNDGLWARALVVSDEQTTVVLVSVDAVAIGGIGPIKNDYLPTVRAMLEETA